MLLGEYLSVSFCLCRRARKTRLFHRLSRTSPPSAISYQSPKAFYIVNTEPADSEVRNVIVRLGAFHAQMSFLGAIGHLMAESGLKEILEMIYASNAVHHMLSGKAVSRAVRGHLIIDAALNALLYLSALGIPIT